MNNDNCIELNKLISKKISRLVSEIDTTINEFVELSGVPRSTLINIRSGMNHSIQLNTLFKILIGLNINIYDFFNDEEFVKIGGVVNEYR